jgi:poly-gamma-glutamate system protein
MIRFFFSRRRNIPKEYLGKNERIILVLFILSILFFVVARFFPSKEGTEVKREMTRASEIMAEAEDFIKECRREKGLVVDKSIDPNFAALVVFLLKELKIKSGETIAVGASGSFPALIVAVLSAARTMNLNLIMISSLGASQWGANNPDFHWLDMQNCLLKAGLFDARPIGLSLGGDKDDGVDMSPEGRSFLVDEIRKSGVFFLQEPDLKKNVEARMRLYQEKAGRSRIKAFINIGGSWPDLGDDSEVLKLRPGLVKIKKFPAPEKRGVIFSMAARKIPVVHLLFIKGLVDRYGLGWDPVPLPQPGKEKIYQLVGKRQASFLFLAAAYFLLIIIVLVFRDKLSKR